MFSLFRRFVSLLHFQYLWFLRISVCSHSQQLLHLVLFPTTTNDDDSTRGLCQVRTISTTENFKYNYSPAIKSETIQEFMNKCFSMASLPKPFFIVKETRRLCLHLPQKKWPKVRYERSRCELLRAEEFSWWWKMLPRKRNNSKDSRKRVRRCSKGKMTGKRWLTSPHLLVTSWIIKCDTAGCWNPTPVH